MNQIDQNRSFIRFSNPRAFGSARGFTIFEMMIAIVVSAIIAFVAIPRFDELNVSMERMNVRKTLLLDLRRAQAETVTTGCRGIFKITPAATGYSYGCDYLDYDPAVPPSADLVIFSRTLPTHFQMSADNIIIFNSKGQLIDELGFIDSRAVTLSDTLTGAPVAFATGTILGTGLFEFN